MRRCHSWPSTPPFSNYFPSPWGCQFPWLTWPLEWSDLSRKRPYSDPPSNRVSNLGPTLTDPLSLPDKSQHTNNAPRTSLWSSCHRQCSHRCDQRRSEWFPCDSDRHAFLPWYAFYRTQFARMQKWFRYSRQGPILPTEKPSRHRFLSESNRHRKQNRRRKSFHLLPDRAA